MKNCGLLQKISIKKATYKTVFVTVARTNLATDLAWPVSVLRKVTNNYLNSDCT